MTEIPEHLLKRSRERRQSLGLPVEGGDPAGAPAASNLPATTAASTPATAPGAAPPAPPRPPRSGPAAPPAPKPLSRVVIAAQRRRRIPLWAMPVLAALPLWIFIYIEAMQQPKKEVTGPLAAGAKLYASNCASCHGAEGGGGVGYQLSAGQVLLTFPKFEDHVSFIETGNAPYLGKPYGNPDRPGGQRIGGARGNMPTWGIKNGGTLTDDEIIAVVCDERFTLAGESVDNPDFAKWCTPEAAAARAAGG